ncbi:MAG: hypothetical protein V1859_02475 [archaeon]
MNTKKQKNKKSNTIGQTDTNYIDNLIEYFQHEREEYHLTFEMNLQNKFQSSNENLLIINIILTISLGAVTLFSNTINTLLASSLSDITSLTQSNGLLEGQVSATISKLTTVTSAVVGVTSTIKWVTIIGGLAMLSVLLVIGILKRTHDKRGKKIAEQVTSVDVVLAMLYHLKINYQSELIKSETRTYLSNYFGPIKSYEHNLTLLMNRIKSDESKNKTQTN